MLSGTQRQAARISRAQLDFQLFKVVLGEMAKLSYPHLTMSSRYNKLVRDHVWPLHDALIAEGSSALASQALAQPDVIKLCAQHHQTARASSAASAIMRHRATTGEAIRTDAADDATLVLRAEGVLAFADEYRLVPHILGRAELLDVLGTNSRSDRVFSACTFREPLFVDPDGTSTAAHRLERARMQSVQRGGRG